MGKDCRLTTSKSFPSSFGTLGLSLEDFDEADGIEVRVQNA